jgi:hypothetical protein
VLVDPSNPWEVQRVAVKYMRKGQNLNICDSKMKILKLGTCVEDVIADGTNTIFLVPTSEMDTDKIPTAESDNKRSKQKVLPDM